MKVAVPSIMSQAGKDYLTNRGFERPKAKAPLPWLRKPQTQMALF
ncbi:hypothetical protein [Limosilactobacillus mucosae]|nr:hypothetical protein SAMN05216430_103127 [Limosilactobacillus mucosae]SFK00030.1 hypothetical protein SAMN05216461_103123 [Limosilactobacillus mucosae]